MKSLNRPGIGFQSECRISEARRSSRASPRRPSASTITRIAEVVDLVELAALLAHLVVDGVEVLRLPDDHGRDVGLLELEPGDCRRLLDLLLPVSADRPPSP